MVRVKAVTLVPQTAVLVLSEAPTVEEDCFIFNKSSIRLSTFGGQLTHFYFWPSDIDDSGDLRLWTGRIVGELATVELFPPQEAPE